MNVSPVLNFLNTLSIYGRIQTCIRCLLQHKAGIDGLKSGLQKTIVRSKDKEEMAQLRKMSKKSVSNYLLLGGTEGWGSATWRRLAPFLHLLTLSRQWQWQQCLWGWWWGQSLWGWLLWKLLPTRYMIRVRNVNGGGSRESGSKNCIARYSRAYLRKVCKILPKRNINHYCQVCII